MVKLISENYKYGLVVILVLGLGYSRLQKLELWTDGYSWLGQELRYFLKIISMDLWLF